MNSNRLSSCSQENLTVSGVLIKLVPIGTTLIKNCIEVEPQII